MHSSLSWDIVADLNIIFAVSACQIVALSIYFNNIYKSKKWKKEKWYIYVVNVITKFKCFNMSKPPHFMNCDELIRTQWTFFLTNSPSPGPNKHKNRKIMYLVQSHVVD